MNNGRGGGGEGVKKREEIGKKNNIRRERGERDGAASEDKGRIDRKFYVC